MLLDLDLGALLLEGGLDLLGLVAGDAFLDGLRAPRRRGPWPP